MRRVLSLCLILLATATAYSRPSEDGYTRTLFLNFRGVTLKNGPWDPLRNTATMPVQKSAPNKARFPFYSPPCKTDDDCREGKCSYTMPEPKAHTYNPFKEPNFKRCSKPDPHHEALIVYHTKQALADFNVDVVSERPRSGDYDMVIFNYNSTIGVPDGGSAGLVCSVERGNMIFFVQDSRWGHEPRYLAAIVAHEFGHTLGLGHNVATGKTPDPMDADDGSAPRFLDKCVRHDFRPGGCHQFARRFCPPGKQNTYRTLMAGLGPRQGRLDNPLPNEFPDQVFTDYQGKQDSTKRHMFCKGSYLVGLKWHRGAIIDQVRGICASGDETGFVGSDSGPGPFQFVCTGPGNRVAKVSVWAFGFSGAIDGLEVTCTNGETGGPRGGGGQGRLQSPPLSCGDGKITGLSGNRGGWLNSLALACGD